MDIVTLAAAMAYTKKTADALGAVKGAPCTIQGITDIEGGHRITFAWTSASGKVETSNLDVMNGEQGQQGEPGQPGAQGLPGNDGTSPTVTITDIPGGHRVTITDAEHPEGQSFDVMDGKDGSGGGAATLQEMFNDSGNNALVIESDNRESEVEPCFVIRNNWYGQPTSDWSTNGVNFFASEGEGSATYGRGEISLENGEGDGFNMTPSTVGMSADLTSAFKAALDIEETFTQAEKEKLEGLSNYDDSALSERVTANETAIADRYTKSETNAYVASQVTPKAEIEINESSNAMDIVGGGRHASFNVNTDGDMEMMLAEPGTYLKTATVPSKTNMETAISEGVAESKAYTDNKTLAATGWGVARTGVATVEFSNSKWSSGATVDVSDLGFSSGAEYDVVAQPTTGGTATPWGNAVAFVNANKGAASFSVSAFTMEESLSGTVNIKYTIFAKGYGAVAYTGEIPTGGTTGQVLTKRSDAEGDYGWVTDGGSGTHFEVGAEKWYGTYTENGVTYQVYSKLIDIGALPSAAGTTQYPHGITGIKQILQINGFTNDGFVMNAPRQNAQDNISIYQAQKSGNIAVEVGKDRSSKNGFVMLIYAKNN